nr:hypothetical protein [Frankia sp. Cas4]
MHAGLDPHLAGAGRGAGPSNIGNYLAGLGIPATAGFGVAYEGMHAAYYAAVFTLLR